MMKWLTTIILFMLMVAACNAPPPPTPVASPTPDSLSHYNQGLAYLDQGEYQQAIEAFNRAAELDPNNSDIYASRGLAHHWLGAYGEAGADYGKAIELNPDNYLPYYNRGVSYNDRGQHERALADYRRAVEHNPDDPLSHNNLAWTLVYHLDTGYEEALEHALLSVELDSQGYNNDTLALALYKLGHYTDAIYYYTEALALTPDQYDSFRGRGDAHLALDEREAALEDYQAYLSLAPEGPERDEVAAKVKSLSGR